ncbi:MAG TPA: amidohydrolase family protein [Candidatus Acidoferrales bacterium]|nr:amidohydrolase family protein [Candidatus Acidoferrales bacterium]
MSLVFMSAVAAPNQAAPDVIIFDGKIFTSDSAHSYVQALAIRGERITATGDSAKIKSFAGPHTKQIDVGGRTVIPGINDAHNHVEVTPGNTVELQFESLDPTWTEVRSALAAPAVTKAPMGAFVRGYVGPSVWKDLDVTRDVLDKIAPDHPVILFVTEHASMLNSAALDRLGIRQQQANPLGGRHERSADGRLSGVLREYASMQAVRKLADLTSDADAVAELRKTLSAAVAWGITSIQDMSAAIAPNRCVALLEKVPTPIRVRVMRMPGTTPAGRDVQEGRPEPRSSSALITVSGTKWMLDGTPLERTFDARDAGLQRSGIDFEAMFSDLALTFPSAEIEKILRESLQDNDQLLVHVFGYNSAAAILNSMQATGGKRAWAGRRVRFEHGDGLFPDLIPLVREMKVVVVQNPSHLNVASIFPGLFLVHAQPLRSLLAADIPVALGSDGPTNPYLNIMFACLHANRPSEAISREQAVVAYTQTSAYAELAEKDKGTLEAGKLADLAVLSQDIFTVPLGELPTTQSVLTMVGGKIVYDVGVVH